jgi:TorA maturation chaperone TorD
MSITEFSELFEILSEVFLDPEADVKLRLSALAGGLSDDGGVLESLRSPIQEIVRLGDDKRRLAVEYVRLFMHGTTNPTVHPYESVQSRGRLMDHECLQDLRNLFDRADVRPREDVAMPPDHLGLELEFLAFVLGNLASAPAGSISFEHWRSIAADTVESHLLPFGRKIVAHLDEADPDPYYRLSSQVLVAGLEQLECRLAGIASEVSSGNKR